MDEAYISTSLVYQKRPALVPVLDRVSRMSLPLPGRRETPRRVFRAVFDQFHALGRLAENEAALDRLLGWVARQPEACRYLAFSRLRLLNIVAAAALAEAYESPAIRQRRARRRKQLERGRADEGAEASPGEPGWEGDPAGQEGHSASEPTDARDWLDPP